MKTMKWTLFLAFFAFWACQEEQISQEGNLLNNGKPYLRVERLRTIKRVDNHPLTRAVSVKAKLWQPGDTIRIKFQNADEFPELPAKVIQYAAIWLQHANLYFEYVSKEENADVKIGFNMDTRGLSWSTIGTDCKQVTQNEVSLNFVDLDFCLEEEIQGEVLRNFGHVLGLGFEHRSPTSPIQLNSLKTNRYFGNKLSQEDIVNEILPYYNSDQTNYTEFDPLSIMVLKLPTSIQADPRYGIALNYNYELSENDILFVRDSLYPLPKRQDCLIETQFKGQFIMFNFINRDSITIDWGDGNKQTFGPCSIYESQITHQYNGNRANIYTIKVFGPDTTITQSGLQSTDTIGGSGTSTVTFYANKNLTSISCIGSKIYALNISKCSELFELVCSGTQISSIDLSQNKKLQHLNVNDNQLQEINISENKDLAYLFCRSNQLNTLNISQNRGLQMLECNENSINSINLYSNTNLEFFSGSYNKLITLDISRNEKLMSVHINNNYKLSNINFGNNKELFYINCAYDTLTSLNISSLTKLRVLYMHNNAFLENELEKIANNITDCTGLPNGGSGSLTYSPESSRITEIFRNKNWLLSNPNWTYGASANKLYRPAKLNINKSKTPILFNKLYGDR